MDSTSSAALQSLSTSPIGVSLIVVFGIVLFVLLLTFISKNDMVNSSND